MSCKTCTCLHARGCGTWRRPATSAGSRGASGAGTPLRGRLRLLPGAPFLIAHIRVLHLCQGLLEAGGQARHISGDICRHLSQRRCPASQAAPATTPAAWLLRT